MTCDDLRIALESFMAAAETKDSGRIADALERITDCQRALGDKIDPALRHYLERRSYQKALEFLGGESPEKGSCR